jgi:regulator of protease activity HflC (stomatin/prohibitin superfamily)
VEAGHVGVVTTWGAADQNVLDPGFHVRMPFATHITSVDVRVQKHSFHETGAASKELQNVYMTGGVNYKIDKSKVVKLYTDIGLDFDTKVFDPAFQDFIKAIVPQYTVTDILAKREQIRGEVQQKLAATAKGYGIDVIDVFITNVHFDQSYEHAIADKQVSAQKLEQSKIDAQTKVTQAKAEADSNVAKATGDAQANALRSQNLSPTLNQYNAIAKWDGKLPNVTSGVPFISVSP